MQNVQRLSNSKVIFKQLTLIIVLDMKNDTSALKSASKC